MSEEGLKMDGGRAESSEWRDIGMKLRCEGGVWGDRKEGNMEGCDGKQAKKSLGRERNTARN